MDDEGNELLCKFLTLKLRIMPFQEKSLHEIDNMQRYAEFRVPRNTFGRVIFFRAVTTEAIDLGIPQAFVTDSSIIGAFAPF